MNRPNRLQIRLSSLLAIVAYMVTILATVLPGGIGLMTVSATVHMACFLWFVVARYGRCVPGSYREPPADGAEESLKQPVCIPRPLLFGSPSAGSGAGG